MSDARDEILRRVRSALGEAPRPPLDVPRAYRTGGELPAGDAELLALLENRLVHYRAGVRRCDPAGLPAAVAEALATALARRVAGPPPGRPSVLAPPELDKTWLGDAEAEVVVDGAAGPLAVADMDECDAVVTAARVAIAETGTIVLDGGGDQGRRALTLVPDVHVCVVALQQVVATVPDAMPLIDPTRPLTWISGPSATSDIELERVEGVHGPRILEVVLLVGAVPQPCHEHRTRPVDPGFRR